MNLFISLISGIIAAFTPCVVVLFPIILYRFINKQEKNWKLFLIFILGFVTVYLASSYALAELLTSQLQEGMRLGIGFLFVALGLLGLFEKINPLNFPIIKNPFLLGSTFALLVALNPCTLPYLGVILASSKGAAFANLAVFGIGLLAPAILFAIFGQKILNITRLSGAILKKITQLMNIILVLTGGYLVFTINSFGKLDSYAATALLIILFMVLLKSFFIINEKKDLFKLKNIFLITGLVLLILTLSYHCSKTLNTNPAENISTLEYLANPESTLACTGEDITGCAVCQRCIALFATAAVVGAIGIILSRKYQ